MGEEETDILEACMACTDTKTPHKLSGQSTIYVAWTSQSTAVETTQPPVETSVNTKKYS